MADLQNSLAKTGYYQGSVTGKYDEETDIALSIFVSEFTDLSIIEKHSTKTLERIFSEKYHYSGPQVYGENTTATKTPESSATPLSTTPENTQENDNTPLINQNVAPEVIESAKIYSEKELAKVKKTVSDLQQKLADF